MTKTGSKYRCPIWGNDVYIVRNASGNLVYCGQAIVEIGQGFMYLL